MRKVLLTEPIHPSGIKILEEAGLEVVVSSSTDTATIIENMSDDIFGIIVRTSLLEGKVLESGRNLKIISRTGIGYNNVDISMADRLNIIVTNVPDANSYSVAEYVIATILVLSRKLIDGDKALREGRLTSPGASLPGLVREYNLGGNELPGKCLGIVGLGKIGRLIAEKANGLLRMAVIAYDPYQKEVPEGVRIVKSVEEVYRTADFITLNTPLTKDTEGMISATQLTMMKPTAYLINAARGQLIIDQDLADALHNGAIAGAAIDVFRSEPPSLDNPLFTAPNVLLTPHIAGSTAEAVKRMAIGSASAVVDLYSGKKPANIVNPKVWERLNNH